MSDIIGFMIVGLVLAYFLCQFLSLLAVIYIVIKKSDRFDKIVFITELGPREIVERMKTQNIRDIVSFTFYQETPGQNYILSTREINKDWHYKEGKVKYEVSMKTVTEGTEITLSVIERSSPRAQLRYGKVMKKFMHQKLGAE